MNKRIRLSLCLISAAFIFVGYVSADEALFLQNGLAVQEQEVASEPEVLGPPLPPDFFEIPVGLAIQEQESPPEITDAYGSSLHYA